MENKKVFSALFSLELQGAVAAKASEETVITGALTSLAQMIDMEGEILIPLVDGAYMKLDVMQAIGKFEDVVEVHESELTEENEALKKEIKNVEKFLESTKKQEV